MPFLFQLAADNPVRCPESPYLAAGPCWEVSSSYKVFLVPSVDKANNGKNI